MFIDCLACKGNTGKKLKNGVRSKPMTVAGSTILGEWEKS